MIFFPNNLIAVCHFIPGTWGSTLPGVGGEGGPSLLGEEGGDESTDIGEDVGEG